MKENNSENFVNNIKIKHNLYSINNLLNITIQNKQHHDFAELFVFIVQDFIKIVSIKHNLCYIFDEKSILWNEYTFDFITNLIPFKLLLLFH